MMLFIIILAKKLQIQTTSSTIKFWCFNRFHKIINKSFSRVLKDTFMMQNIFPYEYVITVWFHTLPTFKEGFVHVYILLKYPCIRMFLFSAKSYLIGVFRNKGRYWIKFACVKKFVSPLLTPTNFLQGCVLNMLIIHPNFLDKMIHTQHNSPVEQLHAQ